MNRLQTIILIVCSLTFTTAVPSNAQANDRWIGTWSASPEGIPNTDSSFGETDLTYREIIHTSVGGTAARIVLTNELGLGPLTIGAASIAMSDGKNSVLPTTIRNVLFDGRASVTLPAGTKVVSDPVDLTIGPLSDLAISLFVPAQKIALISIHTFALQTNYVAKGSQTTETSLPGPTRLASWPFLRGVDVKVSGDTGSTASIVALGDSITDGARSDPDTNGRWPDVLAIRLQASKPLSRIGVLNAGINGNRVLHDGDGQSALGRLDRDVLTQSGVKYLIVLEGINDIGHIVSASASDPPENAESLIRAFSQIITRAHTQGVKVIAATITPYEDCKYASLAGEKMRQTVNGWIRTNKDLDGIADFDKALRDPKQPSRFLPAYDSGDHLHPNAAGLKVMGEAVDLSYFRP